MALISTIRKNSWILIVTMVLAVGGFVLMDIVSNSQRYSAADANTMGTVNGKQIRSADFENYKSSIYANSTGNEYQIRNQVWNYFVEEALVLEQAEPLGLGVPKDELIDLQFGTNLSPVILERFRGNSGQVDMNALSQIKTAIDNGQLDDEQYRDFRVRWAIQENEIIKQRLQDKMTSMVTKGLYAPSWQAEMAYNETNQRMDFLYVRVPYDKVPDADIKVTDDDYAAYLKDNPHLYDQQEESRIISYVSFDVLPTAADSAAAYDKVVKLIGGMKGKDDSLFIVNNDGSYDAAYAPKSALPAGIADRLMSAPLDSVVGPYIDGGSWTVAKVLGRKVLPDSVKARHILVRDQSEAGKQKIDSLKNLISTGKARFDSLAIRTSEDPGSGAKGGDLGYFANGMMVPEFNDVCFNTGEQGKLYTVATQFGWHLIEITGKKFIKNESAVRAAYLSELIRPSTSTQQAVKDKAASLLASVKTLADLEAKASEMGMRVEASQNLKATDFSVGLLGSGNDARSLVRAAYDEDAAEGKVLKSVFTFLDPNGGYYDARYAVAALRTINPMGSATVASLKANTQAEMEVKNRKKAEAIKAKLQGVSDLMTAAGNYGVTVDTAASVSFLQSALPKAGSEPRVIGTAYASKAGQVSAPIVGKSGVYMIQPLAEPAAVPMPSEITMFRRQAINSAMSSIRGGLMNAMKKQAKLQDNRSLFF